jgi:hypothetical protein
MLFRSALKNLWHETKVAFLSQISFFLSDQASYIMKTAYIYIYIYIISVSIQLVPIFRGCISSEPMC